MFRRQSVVCRLAAAGLLLPVNPGSAARVSVPPANLAVRVFVLVNRSLPIRRGRMSRILSAVGDRSRAQDPARYRLRGSAGLSVRASPAACRVRALPRRRGLCRDASGLRKPQPDRAPRPAIRRPRATRRRRTSWLPDRAKPAGRKNLSAGILASLIGVAYMRALPGAGPGRGAEHGRSPRRA